jgi:hypothetical protein
MTSGEQRWWRIAVLVAGLAAGPAAAQERGAETVLVGPVQGSAGLRVQRRERVVSAVRRAIEARGLEVVPSKELGQAVVACQTPECVEQALAAAGASFAVVPAIWSRASGGEELTLTLLQPSGRNLNATGAVGEDLPGMVGRLFDELLARRAAAAAAARAVTDAAAEAVAETRRPRAWKAGPIVLITGGAAAFVAIGIAAGVKSDDQQLDAGAVAAWSAVGAAAIGGGVAWWVVGEKRRRRRAEPTGVHAPTLGFRGTRIDFRLRF